MEYKLISTYTFLSGTQCHIISVALSCYRGPLTSFLLNMAISTALRPRKKVPLTRKPLWFLLHNMGIRANTILS